jgi:hypothetical protein
MWLELHREGTALRKVSRAQYQNLRGMTEHRYSKGDRGGCEKGELHF